MGLESIYGSIALYCLGRIAFCHARFFLHALKLRADLAHATGEFELGLSIPFYGFLYEAVDLGPHLFQVNFIRFLRGSKRLTDQFIRPDYKTTAI